MNGVTNGLAVIIDILSAVIDFALSAADGITDNWSTTGSVVLTAAVASGVYMAVMLGATIAKNLMNGAMFTCPIF